MACMSLCVAWYDVQLSCKWPMFVTGAVAFLQEESVLLDQHGM